MSTYKLRNAFTGSDEDAAALDIQFPGILTAYWWSVTADLDADSESFLLEVSFLSSSTFLTNDARGSISVVSGTGVGTPGFIYPQINGGLSGLRIPVSAGERVHMHGSLSGTANVIASCYLYVEDSSDPRLRRRR